MGVGELLTAHRALAAVDCTSREDARLALRAVLCSERSDLPSSSGRSMTVFGDARVPPGPSPLDELGRSRRAALPHAGVPATAPSAAPNSTRTRRRCPRPGATSSCSATRTSPATPTPEMALARELIARLARRGPTRLSRRTRPVPPARPQPRPAADGPRRRCARAASRSTALARPLAAAAPGRAGLRRVGVDDAVRADAAAVPARVGRRAPAGRGVRVRDAADAHHPRAGRARPRSRAGARRGGGDRLLGGHADRRGAGRAEPRARPAARPRRGRRDPVRRVGPGRSGGAWRSRWRGCGAARTGSSG